MKKIILILAFVFLAFSASCAIADQEIKCRSDHRPLDGTLREIYLERKEGKYQLRYVTSGSWHKANEITERIIADDLDCNIQGVMAFCENKTARNNSVRFIKVVTNVIQKMSSKEPFDQSLIEVQVSSDYLKTCAVNVLNPENCERIIFNTAYCKN